MSQSTAGYLVHTYVGSEHAIRQFGPLLPGHPYLSKNESR